MKQLSIACAFGYDFLDERIFITSQQSTLRGLTKRAFLERLTTGFLSDVKKNIICYSASRVVKSKTNGFGESLEGLPPSMYRF